MTLDPTKHTYELLLVVDGEEEPAFLVVGSYTSPLNGERYAIQAANAILEERPEVQRVKLYHTHPTPGPTRRYGGLVARDEKRIHRP